MQTFSCLNRIQWPSLVFLVCLMNAIHCRELSYVVNPGCDINCDQWSTAKKSLNLVHISSKDTSDTIHFLWSSITSIPPTLLIVKTPSDATLTIDYAKLLQTKSTSPDGGIRFSKEPLNAIGVQFSRLFFFNDINKSGSYDEKDPILEVMWNDFLWTQVVNGSAKDSIELHLKNFEDKIATNESAVNGKIEFVLRVDSSDGRGEELPHLAFTDNSVSLSLNVMDVEYDKTEAFNKSLHDQSLPRLMTSIFVINDIKDNKTKSDPSIDTLTSIDDEYTPGAFDLIHMKVDSNKGSKSENENKAFIQWKPIAYNSDDRIIANTLDVIHKGFDSITATDLTNNNSIFLESFFNNRTKSSHSFNLTFGASDDEKYFDDKKYIGYSFVVGLGAAPEDSLSTLVKMIILVGFGLPALVT
ncbi:unnamed protein product, partial [Oppiella nova]